MIIEFEIENEKYITGIFNDLNGLVGIFPFELYSTLKEKGNEWLNIINHLNGIVCFFDTEYEEYFFNDINHVLSGLGLSNNQYKKLYELIEKVESGNLNFDEKIRYIDNIKTKKYELESVDKWDKEIKDYHLVVTSESVYLLNDNKKLVPLIVNFLNDNNVNILFNDLQNIDITYLYDYQKYSKIEYDYELSKKILPIKEKEILNEKIFIKKDNIKTINKI